MKITLREIGEKVKTVVEAEIVHLVNVRVGHIRFEGLDEGYPKITLMTPFEVEVCEEGIAYVREKDETSPL